MIDESYSKLKKLKSDVKSNEVDLGFFHDIGSENKTKDLPGKIIFYFDATESGIQEKGKVILDDINEREKNHRLKKLNIDPNTRNVIVLLDTDSSLATKATQTTEVNLGYSREAWSNSSGSLFLGGEAKLYLMRLSRFSARFGDITDSKELFDAIDNADFKNDEGFGVDLGALWIGNNYQLGVQWTNINEPEFKYPEVDVAPYSDARVSEAIQRDQIYTMNSQVKLEGSIFTSDRRWSAHLGFDANSATDPLGDDYQWATLSAAWTRPDSFWLPNLRFGWRQNLSGTELGYLSVGATMFRYVNIDIASALDTVEISGTELPQGLMGSIGFHVNW